MVDRLSPQDALFLHMEGATNQMHIASVAIFEGPPPTYSEVLDMFRGRLPLVKRYRQVVRFVPLQLGRPVWVDDPNFNLEYHVRRSALPSPGGDSELHRLVGRVMTQPLDRTKPLWETWIVEGLQDDNWAMLSKVHHSMVDGVSGTDLMAVMMDLSPEPSQAAPDDWRPESRPSSIGLAAGALVDMARSPYEQLRALRASTRVPRQAVRQLGDVVQGLSAMRGMARPTPPTSLNGPTGPHRRAAFASATVEDIKTVRKAWGGTFNDVVLAAITRGFRELLLSRGESVDQPVRTMVPVSVRARDDAGNIVGDGTYNNQVSAMFAELPVDISDQQDRLAAISAQMDGVKESHQAEAAEVLTSLTGFAPPVLLALGTRLASRAPQRNLNTLTSNVPGPQFPLYALGRKMLNVYPCSICANNMRTGISIFSYNGHVNFGIAGDYDTTADIDVLCAGIEQGIHEMVEACSLSSPVARSKITSVKAGTQAP